MQQEMFLCALMFCMLFSKTSKKTRQNAEETASVPETGAQAEVTSKPRTTRSSKSKSNEASETGSVKHRKATPSKTAVAQQAAATAEPSLAKTHSPVMPKRDITHEEIAQLAYSYWVAREYANGSSEQDWLRAERELKSGF
jgi:hypothetical protein